MYDYKSSHANLLCCTRPICQCRSTKYFSFFSFFSFFHLASFKNRKIVLQDIYEEVSNVIGMEQFEELNDYATDKSFGSLIIDTTSNERFLSNSDSEFFIDSAENKILPNK